PVFPVLYTNSPPNVLQSSSKGKLGREHRAQADRPLGQGLINVPVSKNHHLRDLYEVVIRHITMKHVGHRIHENHLGFPPTKRFEQLVWNDSEIEPVLVRMSLHPPKALSKGLRIAVLASGADFRTATDRVPCGISPFDIGVFAHGQ